MARRDGRRTLIAPSASPEEAAAIVAALERFMRATARSTPPLQPPEAWLRVAILEGVDREQELDAQDPWINT